jgi:hypothetical protein
MAPIDRRAALKTLGAFAFAGAAGRADAQEGGSLGAPENYLQRDAKKLRALYAELASIPRRRDFRRLPMILTKPRQWDSEPLDTLIAYDGGPKHVFDTTDIASTWLTQMRNTLNAEVWAFGRTNFLIAAAPHGPAGYLLLTNAAWKKYDIAALTNGAFERNTVLKDPRYTRADVEEPENTTGLYSAVGGDFIPVLQKRGAVFLACHNALWELAETLIARGVNPDGASTGQLVADLTASLIPGVITTPGNEAAIGMLQRAGFGYTFVSD